MDPRTRKATIACLVSRPMLALALSVVALLAVAAALPGCGHAPKAWNDDPISLATPYANTDEIVWVVVPVRNESGVSVADPLRVTDALVNALQETRGVLAVPLNRTLDAMQVAGLAQIDNAAQATALARRMQADAVVVGTLTSWQPYDPPAIGLSIALYARSDAMGVIDLTGLDPRELSRAASDTDPYDFRHDPSLPLSVVALHLDGANGAVRDDLRRFADGRADPNSATGWQGYLAAMSRFERYAAFAVVRELLQREHARLASQAQRAEDARRARVQPQADVQEAEAAQADLVGRDRVLAPISSR
jgi:hypothetical protein